MKKYLYLEPDDDIENIVKKIKKYKDKSVNLVIPAKSAIFTGKNLDDLKSKTDKLGKEIVVHTNDSKGIILAQNAGMAIAVSVSPGKIIAEPDSADKTQQTGKKIKIIYKKTQSPKLSKLKTKKISEPNPGQKKDNANEPNTVSQILFGAISLISIVIIALVILYILPKTDITVTTQSNKIPLDTNITFDVNQSNIDFINNIVPAQIINIDEEVVYEERATGEINNGEKARGTITIYNKSGSVLPLVGNTRFITNNGIQFRSIGAINVPAGGSANVSVVADQIGESGNIGPSTFTLPALPGSESLIYGQSSAAMIGGTNNITYVISEADLNFSTDEAKNILYEKALQDIDDKLPQDRKYITPNTDNIEILTEFSHKVGDRVDTFNITAKTTYSFLVYGENDLLELINQSMSKLVSQDRSVVSDENKQEYSMRILESDTTGGVIKINLTTQAVTTPTYNTDIMKKELAGLSREEVKEYFLQYPEIQQIDISFWPDWVKRVSKIPSRINVEIVWK